MPTFSHKLPGPLQVANRIVISNACVQNTNTDFEIVQPANSVVEKVFVRVLGAITVASAVDVGFNLGTNSDHSGGEVVASVSDGILDGTDALTVAANNVFSFTVASTAAAGSPSTTSGTGTMVADETTLYGRIATGNAAVSGDNQLEISVVYRVFE